MSENKKTIFFSVNGIGLGHASRTAKIIDHILNLDRFRIIISTFGDAIGYFKKKYMNLDNVSIYSVPSFNFVWSERGLELNKTITTVACSFVPTLYKQFLHEKKLVEKFSPAVIINDSMFSPLILSKIYGVPVVTITNQLYVLVSILEYNLLNVGLRILMPKIWYQSESIIIPDLPPPYTISGANVLNCPHYIMKKCHFVGLIDNVSDIERFGRSYDGLYDVYISVSGPLNDRKQFFLNMLRIVKSALKRCNYHIAISGGEYNKNYTLVYNNIEVYSWVKSKTEFIRKSKIIVLRGGLTSILETILIGKPMIVIPASGQTEQQGNALSVSKLGIGVHIDYLDLLKRPELLLNAIEQVLNHYEEYLRRLDIIRRILINAGGITSLMKILTKWL